MKRFWRFTRDGMLGVALQMLTGDVAKFAGLVTAISFSSFLMAHQASIFWGLMRRTTSQIQDVVDASIWVMDPATQYWDEDKALSDNALYRVRGVDGVAWAVPFFKSLTRATYSDGRFRGVLLIGADDATLVGAPRSLIVGSLYDLKAPDSIIIDEAGYRFFFPTGPFRVGQLFEMNDHRARVVGICRSSPPFQTVPVFYTRYSSALRYVGHERKVMSFVLAKPQAGLTPERLAARISDATGLRAWTTERFTHETIFYYIHHTGIPFNFGITVFVALLVGMLVAGQTFYIFTIENLKQFATLKAVGITNARLTRMILLQAGWVGFLGYSTGMAGCALFFLSTKNVLDLRGFALLPPIAVSTGVVIALIITAASLLSIRKVWQLEPAIVFRG